MPGRGEEISIMVIYFELGSGWDAWEFLLHTHTCKAFNQTTCLVYTPSKPPQKNNHLDKVSFSHLLKNVLENHREVVKTGLYFVFLTLQMADKLVTSKYEQFFCSSTYFIVDQKKKKNEKKWLS